MAKSARASTRKANNRRLVKNVFGPAEAARNERLSAKLLELAKQPKPESSDVNMNSEWDGTTSRRLSANIFSAQEEDANDDAKEDVQDNEVTCEFGQKRLSRSFSLTCLAMDVDSKKPSSGRIEKKRVDKRKQKASKIVFKSYGGRSKGKKKSS